MHAAQAAATRAMISRTLAPVAGVSVIGPRATTGDAAATASSGGREALDDALDAMRAKDEKLLGQCDADFCNAQSQTLMRFFVDRAVDVGRFTAYSTL